PHAARARACNTQDPGVGANRGQDRAVRGGGDPQRPDDRSGPGRARRRCGRDPGEAALARPLRHGGRDRFTSRARAAALGPIPLSTELTRIATGDSVPAWAATSSTRSAKRASALAARLRLHRPGSRAPRRLLPAADGRGAPPVLHRLRRLRRRRPAGAPRGRTGPLLPPARAAALLDGDT